MRTRGDAAPAIKRVQNMRGMPDNPVMGRYRGTFDKNVLDDVSAIHGKLWGIGTLEAQKEIVGGKTDRGLKVWNMITKDSEYRKFQNR